MKKGKDYCVESFPFHNLIPFNDTKVYSRIWVQKSPG